MIDTLPSNDDASFSGAVCLVTIGGLAATLLMTEITRENHCYTPLTSYVIQHWEASSSVSRIELGLSSAVPGYQPTTPLARKLLAIRERAIAKGMILLSEEEVFKEVEFRRGEANYA
ncbi:MAG: hypothetical protein HQK85_06520 [Nitrospinae bacterium]|nr:hypothetical protein [Nitrospinota bacterium]